MCVIDAQSSRGCSFVWKALLPDTHVAAPSLHSGLSAQTSSPVRGLSCLNFFVSYVYSLSSPLEYNLHEDRHSILLFNSVPAAPKAEPDITVGTQYTFVT